MKTISLLFFILLLVLVIKTSKVRELENCLQNSCSLKKSKSCTRKCYQKYIHDNVMSESHATDEPVQAADLFGMYHTELIRFLRRGTTKQMSNKVNLQIVTQPIQASWYQNPENLNFFTMSARVGLGPQFELTDGRSFDTAYAKFLDSLDIPLDAMTPSQKKELDALYNEEDVYQLDRDIAEGECMERWQKTSATFQLYTFEEYARKVCSNYLRKENKIQQIQGTIQSFRENFQYGGTKQFEVMRAIKSLREVPQYKRRFIELNPLSNFVNNYKNGLINPFKVIMRSSSFSSEQRSKYSKFGFTLIVLNVAGTKQNFQLTTSKRDFGLTFGAESFSAIRVIPDPAWFSGEVISNWKNGPFRINSRETFFGENGELSSLIRTIYVVYRPRIELIVSREDADRFMKASSFGMSVSIYGISLGFNTAKGRQEVKDNQNLSKLIFDSTSDEPQIIAVDSEILGI